MKSQNIIESTNVVLDNLKNFAQYSQEKEIISFIDEGTIYLELALALVVSIEVQDIATTSKNKETCASQNQASPNDEAVPIKDLINPI